jgi:uncharacterized membrane protein
VAILSRIVNVVFLVIFAIIVIGILLYVLEANEANPVVGFMLSTAAFLVGPFRHLFEFADNNVQVALNWGIAAIVYLIVGIVIARVLERTVDRRVGG